MTDLSAIVDAYLRDAAEFSRPGDTISRITVAKKSYVQSLPVPPREHPDSQTLGELDASNLAAGLSLALAIPDILREHPEYSKAAPVRAPRTAPRRMPAFRSCV